MKVKVPTTAKSGPYRYKVLYDPHLHHDNDLLGQICHREEEIRVEPYLADTYKIVTFCHELIHLWGKTYGFDIAENLTDQIATGIAEFLQDNLDIQFDWSDIKELND